MTVYALDTNIVSYLLQKRAGVIRRLDEEIDHGNQVVIPPIVYYEIRRGLLAADATAKGRLFEALCSDLGVGDIDVETLEIAAATYARLKKAGLTTDDADLLIAAYCIRNGFTLVTNNTKHFEHIEGLSFLNWLEMP
jgi:predicted nucleic acid-binding protein